MKIYYLTQVITKGALDEKETSNDRIVINFDSKEEQESNTYDIKSHKKLIINLFI